MRSYTGKVAEVPVEERLRDMDKRIKGVYRVLRIPFLTNEKTCEYEVAEWSDKLNSIEAKATYAKDRVDAILEYLELEYKEKEWPAAIPACVVKKGEFDGL